MSNIELVGGHTEELDAAISPAPDPDVRGEYFSTNDVAAFRLADILNAGWEFFEKLGPVGMQASRITPDGQPNVVQAWLFFFRRTRPGAKWPHATKAMLLEYMKQARALGESIARVNKDEAS